MSNSFRLTLSDEAYQELDAAAVRSRTDVSEVLRKATTLYLHCLDAQKRGKKIVIYDAETKVAEAEFLGL
jgi:hypothetical protein